MKDANSTEDIRERIARIVEEVRAHEREEFVRRRPRPHWSETDADPEDGEQDDPSNRQ